MGPAGLAWLAGLVFYWFFGPVFYGFFGLVSLYQICTFRQAARLAKNKKPIFCEIFRPFFANFRRFLFLTPGYFYILAPGIFCTYGAGS